MNIFPIKAPKTNSILAVANPAIVKRFIAIFYPPAEYSKVSASVEVEKELFTASGKVCLNQGYLEVLCISEFLLTAT